MCINMYKIYVAVAMYFEWFPNSYWWLICSRWFSQSILFGSFETSQVSSVASLQAWLSHWADGPSVEKIRDQWSHEMMNLLSYGYILHWYFLMICIYGYGSIPIDTFLVRWTSIYQLFWGSLGTRVLTHPHIYIYIIIYVYIYIYLT